jgi:hypothetical protein
MIHPRAYGWLDGGSFIYSVSLEHLSLKDGFYLFATRSWCVQPLQSFSFDSLFFWEANCS